ncbi:MAG: YjbH domain-containing protein [Acetobacterales bacterium]
MTRRRSSRRRLLPAACLAVLLAGTTAGADAQETRGTRLPVSYNDFGSVGLLQTPTARFGRDGNLVTGASSIYPYNRIYLTLQGLPWLEGSFRYTEVENAFFSEFREFSGDQTFKDRGADLKMLLLRERGMVPQIAIGVRDIAGTSQFGAEYLVASKRWYDLDFSLGMGWGNMGTRAHLTNPLSLLSKRFETRQGVTAAGTVSVEQFFSGENVALFGGVSWHTPIDGLTLQVEYDPNNYQSEPLQGTGLNIPGSRNPFDGDLSPINFGAVYAPTSWLSLSAGLERGTDAMLRLNLLYNVADRDGVPKFDDPPAALQPRPALPRPKPPEATVQQAALYATPAGGAAPQPAGAGNWLIVDRLFGGMEENGLVLEDVSFSHRHAGFTVSGMRGRAPDARSVSAAAQLAGGLLPVPVDTLSFVVKESGVVRRTLMFDAGELRAPGPRALRVSDVGRQETTAASSTRDVPPFDEVAVGRAMIDALENDRFFAEAVEFEGLRVVAYVESRFIRQAARAAGRAARVVHNTAPAHIEEIEVCLTNGDLPQICVLMLRSALEYAVASHRGPALLLQRTEVLPPPANIPEDGVNNPRGYPRFGWSLEPRIRQHVGGPDGFYFGQLWAELSAGVQFGRGLGLSGSVGRDIVNNFDGLKQESDSRLPKVRSDIVQYLKQGENNLVHLMGSYHFGIAPEWYGRVSAGLFEEMFGGVSGEILYRPFGEPFAVGLEINRVRQRTFEQRLDFRDYEVTTGHLSLHAQLPWYDMLGAVHVGQYLAGDRGATFELFRDFDSGVRFGVFATFTDVSARDFGEGQFDKGFFISVPLDLFFIRSSKGRLNLPFRPLTRDGGQRLNVPGRLYPILEGGSLRDFQQDADRILE